MNWDKKYIEQLKAQTRRPSTPGDLLEDLAESVALNQGELATRLGVSRPSVNELIRGRRRLTHDMAHRLGRLFGNGPEIWLKFQANLDLWDALHADTSPYESIEPLKEAA